MADTKALALTREGGRRRWGKPPDSRLEATSMWRRRSKRNPHESVLVAVIRACDDARSVQEFTVHTRAQNTRRWACARTHKQRRGRERTRRAEGDPRATPMEQTRTYGAVRLSNEGAVTRSTLLRVAGRPKRARDTNAASAGALRSTLRTRLRATWARDDSAKKLHKQTTNNKETR